MLGLPTYFKFLLRFKQPHDSESVSDSSFYTKMFQLHDELDSKDEAFARSLLQQCDESLSSLNQQLSSQFDNDESTESQLASTIIQMRFWLGLREKCEERT